MYIASSSTCVKFHSFPTGNLVYDYQTGSKIEGPVRSISWSKDGNWLSVVPRVGFPELVSVKNQLKLIHTVTEVEDPSSTAFQNTTRKFIAYGTKTGQTMIYDVKQRKIKNKFPRSSSLISHIEFTARDTHLVVGCLTEVNVFSNLTNLLSCTMRIPKSKTVTALRTNPLKRNYVVGGSEEGVVVVWDTNVNKHKFFVESHKAPVTGVAFSPNNPDLIISTGSDRQFQCYDVISDKCIATIPVNNSMNSVDFSHDGTHFVLGSSDGNISVYDSRRILEPVLIFKAHENSIDRIAFQKQEQVNSNSSLLDDAMVAERPLRNDMDLNQCDSFSNLLPNSPHIEEIAELENAELKNAASESNNTSDSFMAGLGLNRGSMSMLGCSTNGEGDNWMENNSCSNYLAVSNKSDTKRLSLYQRRSLSIKQVSTSTPTFPEVIISKNDNAMSPIVTQMNQDRTKNNCSKRDSQTVPLEHMERLVEEVIERKLTEKMGSLSEEIKTHFSSTKWLLRQMQMDMMMKLIKDFFKVDQDMKVLREGIAAISPLSENYLIEENLRLKRQNALLEQQLLTLMSGGIGAAATNLDE